MFQMTDIFQKLKLKPSQLRTVADRRFEDAQFLCRTRVNARANAAMYLGGFVLECLLKAKLLEKHGWLQNAASAESRPTMDRRLWSLCYRSHNLGEIAENLPEVISRISEFEQRGQRRLLHNFKSLCARWTIYARYSTQQADISEAQIFVDQVKELRPCLK